MAEKKVIDLLSKLKNNILVFLGDKQNKIKKLMPYKKFFEKFFDIINALL